MLLHQKKELCAAACRIRLGIIEATHAASSGHPGGSLSCADALAWLYFRQMNVDPNKPDDMARDRFVLSKGHAAPALYATLAERGYFPVEELKTLRRYGSRLQGHPSMKSLPGVDMSTGSLGQGISAAVGMALAAKLSGTQQRIYALLGDGEMQEGQVWEALMSAAHYKLDNLCVLVDRNTLQIDGRTADVMNPEPIAEKLQAFGLAVKTVNGHDFDELEQAFAWAQTVSSEPAAIVLNTIKGKGVSFMQDLAAWHGQAPNDEQYAAACAELKQQLQELEG